MKHAPKNDLEGRNRSEGRVRKRGVRGGRWGVREARTGMEEAVGTNGQCQWEWLVPIVDMD